MRMTRPVFHSLVATGLFAFAAVPVQAADVALARLACGGQPEPVNVASFSDTYSMEDMELRLTYSCYLVRHGDQYLVWDTGNAMDGSPAAPEVSLVDQLAQGHLAPASIDYVGISHHHGDHTGQMASFPGATLLVGQEDWDILAAAEPPDGMDAERFAERRARVMPWVSGGGTVEPLPSDRHDVFGDGSVVMLRLPGHTPGHHGLLVRLEGMGNVLLTGDVTHFHENYASNGVPRWNSDRADSLASLDRFRKIAEHLDATVVIQHDPRDVDKLPRWPAFAE